MLAFRPLDAAVGVAHQLVTALTAAVDPVLPGAGAAVAIVLFTAAVRLLLVPLTLRQIRGERARARLAPRLKELRDEHRGDPARLSEALSGLYRAEGGSPLTGCLPMLVQMPFFWIMYRLFASPGGSTDGLFGVPLHDHWLAGPVFGAHGLVFLVLFGLLALLAWWSSRRMREAPRLMRLLPYGTVLFAATLPLAAGLYVLTSTAWTALETALLRREPPT